MSQQDNAVSGEIPKGWRKNLTPQHIPHHCVTPAYDIPPPNLKPGAVPFVQTKD